MITVVTDGGVCLVCWEELSQNHYIAVEGGNDSVCLDCAKKVIAKYHEYCKNTQVQNQGGIS